EEGLYEYDMTQKPSRSENPIYSRPFQCFKDTNPLLTDADYISIDSESSTNSNLPNDDFNYILPNNKNLNQQPNNKNSNQHLRLEAKVIINVKSSTSMPAKLFIFNSCRFNTFHYDLIQYIRKCLNNNKVDKDHIKITYKINGRGLEIALDDDCDYNTFITKYKNLLNSTKEMVLYVILGSNKRKIKKSSDEDSNSDEKILKKFKKKLKNNYMLKESTITSNEVTLATIILQIRLKYQYHIHRISCYVE
ncbi:35337_t:CDS:2, partial [Racocetra persica]